MNEASSPASLSIAIEPYLFLYSDKPSNKYPKASPSSFASSLTRRCTRTIRCSVGSRLCSGLSPSIQCDRSIQSAHTPLFKKKGSDIRWSSRLGLFQIYRCSFCNCPPQIHIFKSLLLRTLAISRARNFFRISELSCNSGIPTDFQQFLAEGKVSGNRRCRRQWTEARGAELEKIYNSNFNNVGIWVFTWFVPKINLL